MSTLKEPYRVEGKKTLGYELAEQLAWRLPDVILYPTGGGTGLIGMWKAFDEMEALGWIGPARPRMFSSRRRGARRSSARFEPEKRQPPSSLMRTPVRLVYVCRKQSAIS